MNTPPILTPDQVVTASKHSFSPHKYITFESMFFYCKLFFFFFIVVFFKFTEKHDKNHETNDKAHTHTPRMYTPKYYEPQNIS